MDRHVYVTHQVTLARHPSETDERMMIRLLALAVNLLAAGDHGQLEMAKGMWEPDEPDLWHRDLTGEIKHWVEVGQPDDKRLLKASHRADRVSVYSFSHSTPVWWDGLKNKILRAKNLTVWQVPADQSQQLALMAKRTMQLQITIQDGRIWFGDEDQSVEVQPVRLTAA
jgi:uncharacterized protein YaeQ